MSEEIIRKADKDYSKELDETLPQLVQLASKNFDEALESLLGYEKKTRQANDLASSKRVLTEVVKLLASQPQWDQLNEVLQSVVKKHGQAKQSISTMVQEVINNLDKSPSTEAKLATIETVRSITEGRIYLEMERAQVTRILAEMEVQTHQDYAKAASLMGELQVETFGSMSMTEKIDFILEQVDLYIKTGDFTHAAIASRKIVARYFAKADEDEKNSEQKIRFYELRTQIAVHNQSYLEVCQNLRQIYDTKATKQNDVKCHEILGDMVFYAILAPFGPEQQTMLHNLRQEPDLVLLPLFDQLATMFLASELIRWPKICEVYGTELRKFAVFSIEDGNARWEDFHHRVIEHNIRVIAKFYTRVSFQGLSELLDLSVNDTEEVLAKLVVQNTVWARIDRPKRIITFSKPKDVDQVLNEWSSNTAKLLEHVETLGHLISKEEMIHSIGI